MQCQLTIEEILKEMLSVPAVLLDIFQASSPFIECLGIFHIYQRIDAVTVTRP